MNNHIKNIVEAYDFNGVRKNSNNKNKAIVSNVKTFAIKLLVDDIKNGILPDNNIWNKYKDTPVYKVKSKEELRLLIEATLYIFGEDCSLNWIDTSNITDMAGLFKDLEPQNIDISKWNVSNVKDMTWMFYNCFHFNSDLSKWDVSNVTNMEGMFCRAWKFNCDLSNWNVSKVKNMKEMFLGTPNLEYVPSWYNGIRKY